MLSIGGEVSQLYGFGTAARALNGSAALAAAAADNVRKVRRCMSLNPVKPGLFCAPRISNIVLPEFVLGMSVDQARNRAILALLIRPNAGQRVAVGTGSLGQKRARKRPRCL